MACAPMACAKAQISLGIRPLTRVFAVRMKKVWVLSYSLNVQRRLWSDWADAQADLSLRWAHMPCCWFCRTLAIFIFIATFLSAVICFWCVLIMLIIILKCHKSISGKKYPRNTHKSQSLWPTKGREILGFSINNVHALGKFSIRQIIDFLFLNFPQKTEFDIPCNCLHRRQSAWNVKSYFLGKIRKYFKMSSAESFTQHA